MKAKAEPCLRDYLTIHVPSSTLMGDRLRKRKTSDEQYNPLVNKKLQAEHRKSEVAIIYSSLPGKSFGKKKKMETIPLLANLKLNQNGKLRIVKDAKKAQYNFIFQSKPHSENRDNDYMLEHNSRPIGTSHSSSKLGRSLQTQGTGRQSSTSLGLNDIIHRKFSSTSYQFVTHDSTNRRIERLGGMQLAGFKAHLCEQYGHRKGASREWVQDNQDPRKYPQSGIYISH